MIVPPQSLCGLGGMEVRQVVDTFPFQIPILAVQVLDYITGLHFKVDLRTIVNFTVDIKPLRFFFGIPWCQFIRKENHIYNSTANDT